MRATSFIAVLSGLVAVTSAATLFPRQYPDCANPCIANAETGSCTADDLGCLCNSSAFISSTTSCIISSCNADDAERAEAVARQFCATVGVTLTSTPDISTSASSTSSAPGSSAPSATQTSSSIAPSSTAPSSTDTTSPATQTGALIHGANALLGLVAVGFVALNL
ncbi:unnamed protein product [Somion occarium]|uniref:CFEM domain-containing protein n=1 Tax=Somion occarium TaxID=3059160 RepID=A0ABP1DSZ4_9APHY